MDEINETSLLSTVIVGAEEDKDGVKKTTRLRFYDLVSHFRR